MTVLASRTRATLFAAVLLAAPLIAASGATAQTLVVGGTSVPNGFPFYSGLYDGEYQQVYSSGVFTGPVTITQVAFASVGRARSYNFTGSLGLGTTSATPASPGTSYEANKRADFTTVFTGTQTSNLTGTNTFDLIFNVTPFVYDPANGNLLLDVIINSAISGVQIVGFDAGNSPDTGRLFNANGSGAPVPNRNYGLRTQFTFGSSVAAVPEPSEYAAAGMFGATLLFGMARARRKNTAKKDPATA